MPIEGKFVRNVHILIKIGIPVCASRDQDVEVGGGMTSPMFFPGSGVGENPKPADHSEENCWFEGVPIP